VIRFEQTQGLENFRIAPAMASEYICQYTTFRSCVIGLIPQRCVRSSNTRQTRVGDETDGRSFARADV
jgi:hypothetical protein